MDFAVAPTQVDSWLKANQAARAEDERVNEYRAKLEEAVRENRELRYSKSPQEAIPCLNLRPFPDLLDAQTTVSMMKTDLTQMRAQYEEKCLELEREREKVILAVSEQDTLSLKLR